MERVVQVSGMNDLPERTAIEREAIEKVCEWLEELAGRSDVTFGDWMLVAQEEIAAHFLQSEVTS